MLSLIMPGIRPHNWARVYDSISKSTKRDFELIIISPYELPAELKDKPNIKFIQDWGNPTRCQQLGLFQSEGEVIGAHADDAFYYPDKLDIVLDEFYDTIHPKKSIGAKYLEGDGTSEKVHQTDDYYRLNGSQWTSSPLFSDEWMLFNIIFMNREYLMKLGGWDCQFETTFYGHTDLAVRAQNDGAPVTLLDLDLTDAGYMPERTGDHAPIHNAHVEHDYPLFKSIYSKGPIQSFISIDNWKLASEKWPRRFK